MGWWISPGICWQWGIMRLEIFGFKPASWMRVFCMCFLGHAIAVTLRQACCLLPAPDLPLALWQSCEQPQALILNKTIEKPVPDAPPVAPSWDFSFYRQTATGYIPFITRKLPRNVKGNISVGLADVKHECITYNLKSLLVCCHMQHN